MKCEICGKEFEPKYKSQKFCSRKCVAIYSNKEAKKLRILRYYENPSLCKCCGNIIPFESKQNVFCNSSCAATYNNTHRERKPWGESSREKFKNTLADKNKNKKKYCKYCGKESTNKKCVCDSCNQYTKYITLINNICKCHPEYKIGGLKDIYEKIERDVINKYFVLKDSTLIISNYFNIDDNSVAHIIRRAGGEVRNLKESQFNAIECNRGSVNNIIKSNVYKTGIHETWDGKKFFFRSSYEENYMLDLDSKKIRYEYEPFNIKYYNNKLQEYRYARPDFYLPDTNEIVEIKSIWTLSGKIEEMKDKFKRYKELGYNPVLILEKKKISLDDLNGLNLMGD